MTAGLSNRLPDKSLPFAPQKGTSRSFILFRLRISSFINYPLDRHTFTMATAETVTRPHGMWIPVILMEVGERLHGEWITDVSLDRHNRRQPFARWMKRLANLKNPGSESSPTTANKRSQYASQIKNKKAEGLKNNPYPISGQVNISPSVIATGNGHLSFGTPPSGRSVSYVSPSQSKTSIPISHDGQQAPTISNKSTAPTVSTNPETVHSEAAHSKAATSATAGGAVSSTGMGGGEGSTFSSPAPSIRSLATTLTTIQSAAPSNLLSAANTQPSSAPLAVPHAHHGHHNSTSTFSHQFPSSPPASAIPSHVTNPQIGGGHPATYNTATANNLLSDNASVMTLASSSKRRRRNSLDTNASIRALAPSSIFGGSRESLPLSVLSANVNDQSSITGQHQGRGVSIANPERASVYSSSGIAPAAERNSYYASKTTAAAGDAASARSGLYGHTRNDSITRSISGLGNTDSPLGSPREPSVPQGSLSRRHSGWGEVNEEDVTNEEEDKVSTKPSE